LSEQSPAFQFYARDFLADTDNLTDAAVGLYIRLLCKQWMHESLPENFESEDGDSMIDVLPIGDLKERRKAYRTIAKHFNPHPTLEKCVVQGRLERIRQEQRAHSAAKSEAGRVGGLTTQSKRKNSSSALPLLEAESSSALPLLEAESSNTSNLLEAKSSSASATATATAYNATSVASAETPESPRTKKARSEPSDAQLAAWAITDALVHEIAPYLTGKVTQRQWCQRNNAFASGMVESGATAEMVLAAFRRLRRKDGTPYLRLDWLADAMIAEGARSEAPYPFKPGDPQYDQNADPSFDPDAGVAYDPDADLKRSPKEMAIVTALRAQWQTPV